MNIKLTPKRRAILSTLKEADEALTAAELHAALPHIDLATIYRNLELFSEHKVIQRVQLGGGEAQYEYQDEPHHHAVCDTCHRVIHFTAPDKKIIAALGLSDFAVDELEITVHGQCKDDQMN